MKCLSCNGTGRTYLNPDEAYLAHAQTIDCPACEGEGNLPDPEEFPNHCLACGEPILAEHDYCDFHESIALLDGSHQNDSLYEE